MIRKSIFMGLFIFPTLVSSLQAQGHPLAAIGHCIDQNNPGPYIGGINFYNKVQMTTKPRKGFQLNFSSANLSPPSPSTRNLWSVTCNYNNASPKIGLFASTGSCFFNGNPGQMSCTASTNSGLNCKITCQ